MAKNREPLKPVEESESDSSEEGSSEEEESDADLDPTPPQSKPQPQIPAAKPSQPLPPPSSSDEEDSGSETESESDAPEVIPLAAKPVEETPKSSRKAKSKPAADPVTPAKSSAAAAKRPAEDTAGKGAKKPKKSLAAEPDTAEKKSNMFQRLWSEEDEIVILEGMIEFQNKFNLDPIANLDQYHDFIKKSVQTDFTDFTRTQLQDKIRRLKRKYLKSREKDGKDKTFSKPQEQMAYDLSKAIWGNEEKGVVKVMGSPRANGSVVRRAVGKKEADDGKSREVEKTKTMTTLNRCGATMEERLCIYGEAAFGSGDVENEWNKLKVEELKVYLKQLEVKVAQTKLVLAAMESKD